ncbi:MAG TPA: bifunctional glutamate N-acetyltransferase/amino-acid acetyltransferase ArgJ [Polyangiaceae bacterium]|nr:bifunctional glutamate N-acetyltransferase/amino-acid acetyltransferase ArgJ [Polyangiaceae bacterium]
MPAVPRGFRYAGINAGIKAARRDLALVASEVPCTAAGTFTVNKASAAPVRIAARRLPGSGISAIVANSGNANALTGPEGEQDALRVQRAVAEALGVAEDAVLSASTGVIGVPLPVSKVEAAVPRLVTELAPALESAAEAVMTTDTRPKIARRVLRLGDHEVRIAAFAKGSGMIAPQMATMLAFITTDAAATPEALASALDFATQRSFNRLTVDGDMSTNDSVFLLANGLAGNPLIDDASPHLATFRDALVDLCIELARSIAEDGEGATKLVEVNVRGAPSEDIARDLATSIAGSSLVKAAIFGADPNWGRVLATVGARAGSQRWPIDPDKARVTIQGTLVYDDRGPAKHDATALRKRMREPRVVIDVRLAEGSSESIAWGCDLSYDYVKINADYTSLITATPDGTVKKDDRLTNYSPGFKRALLVEALSYIARFSGRRAVLAYGGGGANDSLLASFARDINLLRSAGLLPIVVHGGRDLAHLLDSTRDLAAAAAQNADPRKMEMLLTGRINTELVSLLNHASAHPAEGEGRARENAAAIGLSGKDAGLFRTKRGAAAIDLPGESAGVLTARRPVSINTDLLEMMLPKYVPVLSPVALGEDGESVLLDSDALASDVAVALKADKLIYLADTPGLLEQGELVTEIGASDLRARLADGLLGENGVRSKLAAGLRALEGGVRSVHVIDGRVPHSVIAELFTDTGVGTLLRPD